MEIKGAARSLPNDKPSAPGLIWLAFLPLLLPMIGVIGTLLGLTLTGLTLVAYRHPEAFKKLYIGITIALAIVYFSQASYDTGYSMGRAEHAAQVLKLNSPSPKMPETSFGFDWKFVIAPCIFLYLTFLNVLPQLGIVSKKN